jgi:hypothetical protein
MSSATVRFLLGAFLAFMSLAASAGAEPSDELDWRPAGLAMAGKDYTNWDLVPAGSDSQKRANYYYYFVIDVTHTLFVDKRVCGTSLNGIRVATIVAKYLNDHPERCDATSAQLIFEAIHPLFPCGSQKGK